MLDCGVAESLATQGLRSWAVLIAIQLWLARFACGLFVTYRCRAGLTLSNRYLGRCACRFLLATWGGGVGGGIAPLCAIRLGAQYGSPVGGFGVVGI